MNGVTSQCSSGCESGWTMYLDHSVSQDPCKRNGRFVDQDGLVCEEGYKVKHMEDEEEEEEDEEEEDLSMVSDASSGPPHFNEEDEECDENGWFSYGSSATALAKKSSKRQKIKDQQHHHQQLQQQHQHNPSLLDDTASSPLFSLTKNNNQEATMENVLDFSQGFSATHFKGKSSFQKHYGLLKSSLPAGTNFRRTSDLQGRKWD